MRLAIPVWMHRVSPLFDTAKRLLLVDIADSTVVGRQETALSEFEPVLRARQVVDLGIRILICGAISRSLKVLLEVRDVEVRDHICGEVEEILKSFLKGGLEKPAFRMPGCQLRPQDLQIRR
jgi:predicted Fe-Mo cluster-binding NifX family protein